MKPNRIVVMGILVAWGILSLGISQVLASSPRQYLRPMEGPNRPMNMPNLTPFSPFQPNPSNPRNMPGWDWERTYPWSPYNYGRNPYNPATLPYYPPNYPPNYAPNYPNYPTQPSLPDGSMVPGNQGPQVLIPHPTGQLKAAPPDAGVIEVRIPDTFGTVLFDGTKTISTGTTRYYVTPSLPSGKPMSYTISATWNQNGKPMNGQRTVQVNAGHFSVVDFNEAAKSK